MRGTGTVVEDSLLACADLSGGSGRGIAAEGEAGLRTQ